MSYAPNCPQYVVQLTSQPFLPSSCPSVNKKYRYPQASSLQNSHAANKKGGYQV